MLELVPGSPKHPIPTPNRRVPLAFHFLAPYRLDTHGFSLKPTKDPTTFCSIWKTLTCWRSRYMSRSSGRIQWTSNLRSWSSPWVRQMRKRTWALLFFLETPSLPREKRRSSGFQKGSPQQKGNLNCARRPQKMGGFSRFSPSKRAFGYLTS